MITAFALAPLLALAPPTTTTTNPATTAAPAAAASEASAYIKRYDELMAPMSYEGQIAMTAWREDGSSRSYKMRIQKSGQDKVRLSFSEPRSAVGQEMLRNGDNLWVYMPNLKRAVRLASRESFMGGDFNNADVLRPNWQVDYDARLVDNSGGKVLLELKGRTQDAAWDVVKLWMSSADPKKAQPVRAELYAASGKLLRSVDFIDVKDFGNGVVRPATLTIKNELIPARRSSMTWSSLDAKAAPAAQRFGLDDLGR